MPDSFAPAGGLMATLPLLDIRKRGARVHLRLNRPAKRNALSDPMIQPLHTALLNLPDETRAVVMTGEGGHFRAGLDLAEWVARMADLKARPWPRHWNWLSAWRRTRP